MDLNAQPTQPGEPGRLDGVQPDGNSSRRADEVQSLLDIQRAITSRIEADAILQIIADEARRLTASEVGAIGLFKDGVLDISVTSGTHDVSLPRFPVPSRDSAIIRAVLDGKVVMVEDMAARPDRLAVFCSLLGARSLAMMPLVSAGETLGAIAVFRTRAGSLGNEIRRLLMMLAPGAVIAVENARLYEQAQQAAAMDERRRLARELHDTVTQTLFSASLIADVLPQLWNRDPQEGQARLNELRQLTRGALAEMRSLLLTLDPCPALDGKKEK